MRTDTVNALARMFRPKPRREYHAPGSVVPERFLLIGSATVDAVGAATIRFPGPPRNERWYIDMASLDSVGPITASAKIFKNAEQASNFLTIADPTPNADDRATGLPIYSGESILVVFAGVTIGTTVTARVEGRRVYG